MREIYNRDPDDIYYNPNILEVTDPVAICVGQLKMLLLTDKGEVLGDPKFGLGLESLIFDLDLNESGLRKEIDLYLFLYVPLFRNLGGTYSVEFFVGTQRDIAIIDFKIPSSGSESPVISLKFS
jgi:hypothetical protein